MQRLIFCALLLVLGRAGLAQDLPTDLESEEPDLRRYSVELIVFAYAEDVATGSELFLPEMVEVTRPPEIDLFGDFGTAEGPVPDDSVPDDEPGLPEGVSIDENGELINEDGLRVDELGEVVLADGVIVGPDGAFFDEEGRPVNQFGALIDDEGQLINEDGLRIDEFGEILLGDGVFTGPDGRFFNSSGEIVNQFGYLLDEDGNAIIPFDPYETVLFTADELTMLDMFDRLDRLDAYEPLLHVGWAQPALPEAETTTLAIEDFGNPVDGLEGAFTLYLSRYLHLVVDLDLAAVRGEEAESGDGDEPRALTYEETVVRYGLGYDERPGATIHDDAVGIDEDADPEAEFGADTITMVLPLTYSISENRIVASGDVRYFDHPKFGVIARVERVELPEDEEDEEGLDAGFDDTGVLSPVSGQ